MTRVRDYKFLGFAYVPGIVRSLDRDGIRYAELETRWRFVFRKTWAWCLISLVLFVFIPSSNTMYAVAASQVGEQVVKSEAIQGVANDATKALQSWIKRQIEPVTEKPENKKS